MKLSKENFVEPRCVCGRPYEVHQDRYQRAVELDGCTGYQASQVTTEQVAEIVNGIVEIGRAKRQLEEAGMSAWLAANRITVNQQVIAELIHGIKSPDYWIVVAMDGSSPTWVVGTEGSVAA